MEQSNYPAAPDNTAVRVALWRALHVAIDAPPHILEDTIGLQLIAPDPTWRERPDMDPVFTRGLRASIVGRARFVEDLIIEQHKKGVTQYVLLGAGLDTFAQRRPDIASQLRIYEIDQPGTQAWKQQRLTELGFPIPDSLQFIPVNFEISSWWEELTAAGFDTSQPAVVACTGVSMYLTQEAIAATLHQVAQLAKGSILAMTFLLPAELLAEADRPLLDIAKKGAAAAGTPFLSFFAPGEIAAAARSAGFKHVEIINTENITEQYFTNRSNDLRPITGEEFLLAVT